MIHMIWVMGDKQVMLNTHNTHTICFDYDPYDMGDEGVGAHRTGDGGVGSHRTGDGGVSSHRTGRFSPPPKHQSIPS